MARRWTAAAVTCLATALLAGCSGGTQQASTTLPTTSAPTAAASPTLPPLGPADFPVPAEAREKTPEGVNAFTRYYVAPDRPPQTSELDPRLCVISAVAARPAPRLADSYDEMKAAGHRYEGGALTHHEHRRHRDQRRRGGYGVRAAEHAVTPS